MTWLEQRPYIKITILCGRNARDCHSVPVTQAVSIFCQIPCIGQLLHATHHSAHWLVILSVLGPSLLRVHSEMHWPTSQQFCTEKNCSLGFPKLTVAFSSISSCHGLIPNPRTLPVLLTVETEIRLLHLSVVLDNIWYGEFPKVHFCVFNEMSFSSLWRLNRFSSFLNYWCKRKW